MIFHHFVLQIKAKIQFIWIFKQTLLIVIFKKVFFEYFIFDEFISLLYFPLLFLITFLMSLYLIYCDDNFYFHEK